MTAAVVSLQAGLKGAIEAAHVATPFVPPVTVRVADLSIAEPPADNTTDVVIGFEALATIARASTLQLDQYLIPVTIRSRNVAGSQSVNNSLHATTQRIRDLTAAYAGSYDSGATTARVEQLLTPHPFDVPSALQPGVYEHKFVCDFDVIRTVATAATIPTDFEPTFLTKCRNAVWDAVENWIPLGGVFLKKYRSARDLEELALHDPGLAELPAIAIDWGETQPDWWVHSAQQWQQQLVIECWLPFERLDRAELIAFQLMQALYQSAPAGSSVSYVRRATGRPPSKNSPIAIEPIRIGRAQKLQAWKVTLAATLTGTINPNDP